MVRQIRNHDPENATQRAKLVADIIDGNNANLNADIQKEGGPNVLFKTASTPMTPLSLAVAACNESAVRDLLNFGASVDGAGDSVPLVVAASTLDTAILRILLLHGADVSKADSDGHTALEMAVRQHQVKAVQLLLKSDSDVNRKLVNNATILDIVAKSPDPTDQAIAKELRAYGAVNGLQDATP